MKPNQKVVTLTFILIIDHETMHIISVVVGEFRFHMSLDHRLRITAV